MCIGHIMSCCMSIFNFSKSTTISSLLLKVASLDVLLRSVFGWVAVSGVYSSSHLFGNHSEHYGLFSTSGLRHWPSNTRQNNKSTSNHNNNIYQFQQNIPNVPIGLLVHRDQSPHKSEWGCFEKLISQRPPFTRVTEIRAAFLIS